MGAHATRTLFPGLLLTLSASAWLVMWQFGDSPWSHGLHGHRPIGGGLSTATFVMTGAIFVSGWIVMTLAMMLPTTTPLVRLFQRLTAARADRTQLAAALVTGHVLAWTACGVLVFVAIATLRAGFDWAAFHPDERATKAGLLAVAGAFQFSTLKYRCLDQCRSPLGFLASRWQGGHSAWRSLGLGVEHGIFCVGCCWALMLLMFAVSTVDLAWMLALAAAMAIEKTVPWGRRLSPLLGAALLVAAAVIALS